MKEMTRAVGQSESAESQKEKMISSQLGLPKPQRNTEHIRSQMKAQKAVMFLSKWMTIVINTIHNLLTIPPENEMEINTCPTSTPRRYWGNNLGRRASTHS
jgi:hypothetical protein